MSQFSRDLAQQIIRSSAFLETLTDLMASEIENQLRAAAGGDRIYIPKTTSLEDKHTRNQMIRAQFTGANLDALPDAAGVDEKHESMSPILLVAAVKVTVASADLRLYRYDAGLARWVPSAAGTTTVDVGVHELRYNTAGIDGLYAMVNESATGTVEYVFREGRN